MPAAGPDAATAAKRQAFAELHRAGCFVLPNPWDVGSARYLVSLGFPAIATTSAGLAWSRGRPDNGVTLDTALVHLREMSAAVGVPVNADFEGGFAVTPDGVAENVRRAAGTGIAGLSIEDSTGDAAAPLHDFALAVERVRAARAALAGTGVLLVARSEGHLVGRADLDETVRRLVAYSEAGADCLYAPGVRTRDEIVAIVRAVAPKPVNVLVWTDFTTVAELAALGVRRISVGGALARAAWGGFMAAAGEIATQGTFRQLGMAAASAELNGLFASD
jgi:methylisocitrate lyase